MLFVLIALWLADAAHLTWLLKLIVGERKESVGEKSRGPSLWAGF